MFKEIKDKLIKEYNDLVDYHNYCINKAEILYKNTKKNKTEITSGLTIVAFIPVFIAGISLVQRIGMSVTPINMALFMASTTAASVSIGHLGQRLITLNAKRRMRTFTTAYKNRQIIKELANYEIEKAQTEKKMQIIDTILNKIESKENILAEITKDGKYKVTTNNLTVEELNKNYELMLQNYNSKMEDLDILVSQNFLRTKFRDYRKNWDRVPNAISKGVVISLLLSFTTCLALLVNKVKTVPVENELDFIKQIFNGFIPGLALTPITIPLMIRRSNDNVYAFNELNDELGEYSLNQKPDKQKEENLEQNIEKLTNELIELGYSIKETEYTLKTITKENISSDTKQKSILFTPYKPLKITEETRRAILEHPELHSGLSVRARMGKIYTNEEWEQRREEVLSKPLPGDEKKGYTRKRKR